MRIAWKDYLPIIISVLSLLISVFTLGWNVYRDVILKPRARVSVSRGFITNQPLGANDFLFISAVSHGPGKIRLSMIWFRRSSLWLRLARRQSQGVLLHDWHNPQSGQLPVTLEVGEKVDFFFPWIKESVLSHSPTHLGLRDSFDRFHWAPYKEIRGLVRAWRKQFGNGPG
jgi:hypothetical protein